MTTDVAVKQENNEVTRAERTRDRRTYTPNVDIIETQDEFLVVADMPGVSSDAVDIQYEQGVLTLQGRVEPRQDEGGTTYLLQEYGVGDYYRSFRLGEDIDTEKIDARLKDGVLELRLPKSESTKPKKITVKTD